MAAFVNTVACAPPHRAAVACACGVQHWRREWLCPFLALQVTVMFWLLLVTVYTPVLLACRARWRSGRRFRQDPPSSKQLDMILQKLNEQHRTFSRQLQSLESKVDSLHQDLRRSHRRHVD